MRVGHSSFYVGQRLKSQGKRIEEAMLLPEERVCAAWRLFSRHRQRDGAGGHDYGFWPASRRGSPPGRGNDSIVFAGAKGIEQPEFKDKKIGRIFS